MLKYLKNDSFCCSFFYSFGSFRYFGTVFTIFIIICFFTSSLAMTQEPSGEKTQNAEKSKEEKVSETQKILESLLGKIGKEIEEEEKTQETQEPVLEIDGLIINETKTKIGRDFYDFFYTMWEAPEGIVNYTIYIIEKPIGTMGSWIWIKVNDIFIYSNRHKPNREEIENGAKYGINFVQQYLFRRENDEKQLSGQDMSGTGIY